MAMTWYWIGFLAADGCVSDDGDLYLRLAQRDLGHIEALRAFVGAGEPGTAAGRIAGPHKGCYCLSLRSRRITADLERLGGITPRKTQTYTPTARAAAQRAFWLGMLDGDGTAYWHKNNRWGTQTPEVIWTGSHAAMAACWAFWSAQLPNERIAPPRALKSQHLWEVRLWARAAPLAAQILLSACKRSLPRKRSKLQAIAQHPMRTPVRLTRSCTWCGTDVQRYPSQARTPHSFCSREHYLAWWRASGSALRIRTVA